MAIHPISYLTTVTMLFLHTGHIVVIGQSPVMSSGLSILTFLTSTIALFGCRVTPIDQIKKYVIYVLQNLLNHYWLNEVIQAVCKIDKVDHTLHSSPNPWPTDREILIVMTYTFKMWLAPLWLRVRIMVFNTTFNNISAISWQSVLLLEETGVPRENYWPA